MNKSLHRIAALALGLTLGSAAFAQAPMDLHGPNFAFPSPAGTMQTDLHPTVLPPDEPAREAVLRYHLRSRPVAGVDLRKLARKSDGLSGADLAYAWPTAELAVMGSAGAVEIVHRRDLMNADDPATLRKQLIEEYEEQYASPYIAAERGFIDDVIDPADTRRILARSLELLRSKREDLPKRKHGNVPL